MLTTAARCDVRTPQKLADAVLKTLLEAGVAAGAPEMFHASSTVKVDYAGCSFEPTTCASGTLRASSRVRDMAPPGRVRERG